MRAKKIPIILDKTIILFSYILEIVLVVYALCSLHELGGDIGITFR